LQESFKEAIFSRLVVPQKVFVRPVPISRRYPDSSAACRNTTVQVTQEKCMQTKNLPLPDKIP